ncbi:MAG: TIGR02171 family protein [Fibrobacter sp.]|nr:TIGR02171 family protein [Fibrobacter sp.]
MSFRNNCFPYVCLVCVFLLWGCDTGSYGDFAELDYSAIKTGVDAEREGMILVKANGSHGRIGTNGPKGMPVEMPSMRVSFDYDFSLGKHEVTCAEYKTYSKEWTKLFDCEHSDNPVANVTFFDAVLYANARSKDEGYDTAYSYTGMNFDSEGNCIGLDGLEFNPDKDAYRLPTEAEWSLAAAQGWSSGKSWNSRNSEYRTHKVCTKPENEVGFCDMAGNVMEWVNDWKGCFKDTSLSNFAGAPDGGRLGERVVKGGSYRNESNAINLYSRGDVYTVTSSTKADYVGFRIAFGAIPEPSWMGLDGQPVESRVLLRTLADEVQRKTRRNNVILAFRNDISGNIAYVRYGFTPLSVIEIHDTLDAYHPDVSPDGSKVAFCTKPEGVGGESAIYVRTLSSTSKKPIKLGLVNAAIPRWRVLDNGDTVIVFVSDAGNNKNESAWKQESTWQVKFMNGKFGRPEKLFDGTYNGGVSSDNRLAVSGARLLRVSQEDSSGVSRETLWYNGEQACNVSLSNDGSNRTLFLDFAGNTGKDFVGESYKTHQRLLIADSTGKLVQSVGAPDGYTFDHSEWASGEIIRGETDGIAVATLTGSDGSHKKIVLVDLKDSSVMTLAESDELWHPSLRIVPLGIPENSKLDPDSAGLYIGDKQDNESVIWRYKMELFWQYYNSTEILVVGSSRAMAGVNPGAFRSGYSALNMAQTPNSIYTSRDFMRNYGFTHMKNLKYLIVSLDIDFWWKADDEEENIFKNRYEQYPGFLYDSHHDFWKDGYPDGLLELTRQATGNEIGGLYTLYKGVDRGTHCLGFGGPYPEVNFDSTYFDKRPELIDNSLAAVQDMILDAKKHDVHVIGVLFPQSQYYLSTGAYGRYGLRRSKAADVVKRIRELEKKNSNFTLFDENKMGNHTYDNKQAHDFDHLCLDGATFLASRLDTLITKIDQKK